MKKIMFILVACLSVLPGHALFGASGNNTQHVGKDKAAAAAAASSSAQSSSSSSSASSSSSSSSSAPSSESAAAAATTTPLEVTVAQPGILLRIWNTVAGRENTFKRIRDKKFTGATTQEQHDIDWDIAHAIQQKDTAALAEAFQEIENQTLRVQQTGITPAIEYANQEIAQRTAALRAHIDTEKEKLKELKTLKTKAQAVDKRLYKATTSDDQSDDEMYDRDAFIISRSNKEKTAQIKQHIREQRKKEHDAKSAAAPAAGASSAAPAKK